MPPLLRSSALLCLVLACLLLAGSEARYRQKRIVGGTEAPVPPVDDPVVFVRKDDTEARIFGTKDKQTGYYLFRGIRYAEPPVGNRRFRRSVPKYLEGELNATEWGPPCLQPGPGNEGTIGSEDCLFLNVFTPALPDATEGHPVVVWIHGGGFRRGAATQYEMRNLVEKRVIVVSVQYRLGSLGFLSDGSKDLSGNNGMFDMMQAIEWTRNYIEFFGGNPKKITAFGQGSGASAAFLMGLSSFGQNRLSGLIAMSGTPLSNFAIDKSPQNHTNTLAKVHNCYRSTSVEMVYCLRKLPAETFVNYDSKRETLLKEPQNFVTDLSSILGTGPVVEGQDDQRSLPNFVEFEPEQTFTMTDRVPDIPILTGVVKDETGSAVESSYKDIINQTLKRIPDFLVKQLVPSLQKIVPSIGSVVKTFVPEAFGKYLSPFVNPSGGRNNGGDPFATLAKVTDALNDAIFNVPAFLTVKNWSKHSKAFLYSFDHVSKQGFGKHFLDGSPLVGNSKETGKTGHGDDLGYIFEPNTIDGKPMNMPGLAGEDMEVREVFTDLVAQFARSGEAMVKTKAEDGSILPMALPSFTGGNEDDSFLSISAKPKVANKFRYCELGLWTGELERLKSSFCNFLFLDSIKDPIKTVQRTFNTISNVPRLAKVAEVSDFLDLSKIDSPVKIPLNLPSVNDLPGNIASGISNLNPLGSGNNPVGAVTSGFLPNDQSGAATSSFLPVPVKDVFPLHTPTRDVPIQQNPVRDSVPVQQVSPHSPPAVRDVVPGAQVLPSNLFGTVTNQVLQPSNNNNPYTSTTQFHAPAITTHLHQYTRPSQQQQQQIPSNPLNRFIG
ncbi:liver carboxylesterase 1 [Trichogramma pretiosum]|uniref:liver carboxylesterase 1 n=1 Tax=Trichogramma pretiosum TaxID=7493 RepID=UPI0006C9ACED|nr:liver carboxylesterase 1 [Trichogramma pretiosum]